MYRFEEHLHYGKYVTPRLTREAPVYDWYAFPHSFSRELVHELLDELDVSEKTVVFDPFVGAGTTLLACRERGIPAFGIDQLPFAVFASNVKIRNYDSDELQNTLNNFNHLASDRQAFASVPIIDDAFTSDVQGKVATIHNWTQSLPNKQADFFLLALLYILESVSQTAKSGGWLRYVENKVDPDSVECLFKARAQKMIDDVQAVDLPRNDGLWYAMPGDARHKSRSNRSAQYVISSPPYLNRHDYTRVFALEMALHFVETNEELISLRHRAFRSHVEAKPQAEFRCNNYEAPENLINLIAEIKARSTKRDEERLSAMIRGYFEDIYMTLRSLNDRISQGGKIAFVLGNVRFSGVMLPVDEFVAQIGEQVGLKVDRIIVARYRGNSAQQMAQFGREAARESIIIWHKATSNGN